MNHGVLWMNKPLPHRKSLFGHIVFMNEWMNLSHAYWVSNAHGVYEQTNLFCTPWIHRDPWCLWLNTPFPYVTGPQRPMVFMTEHTFPICHGSIETHGVYDWTHLSHMSWIHRDPWCLWLNTPFPYAMGPQRPIVFMTEHTFPMSWVDRDPWCLWLNTPFPYVMGPETYCVYDWTHLSHMSWVDRDVLCSYTNHYFCVYY